MGCPTEGWSAAGAREAREAQEARIRAAGGRLWVIGAAPWGRGRRPVRTDERASGAQGLGRAQNIFNRRASTLGTHYIRRFHRKTERARASTREHARGHPKLDEQGHRYDAPTSAAQKSPQHPRAATPTRSIHGEGPHTPSHDVTDRTKSPWTSFARQASASAGTPDDPLPSVRPLSARRPLPTLCRRTCDARLSLFTSPHLIRTRTALTGTI